MGVNSFPSQYLDWQLYDVNPPQMYSDITFGAGPEWNAERVYLTSEQSCTLTSRLGQGQSGMQKEFIRLQRTVADGFLPFVSAKLCYFRNVEVMTWIEMFHHKVGTLLYLHFKHAYGWLASLQLKQYLHKGEDYHTICPG